MFEGKKQFGGSKISDGNFRLRTPIRGTATRHDISYKLKWKMQTRQ